MVTLILAMCLGICAPAQPAISMSEYQTDQIIWWSYYGEWAPAPAAEESSSRAAKKSNAKEKSSI